MKKFPILETEIECLKSERANGQRFLDKTNKITDIRELSPKLLKTFVNNIVIYEREMKRVKTLHGRLTYTTTDALAVRMQSVRKRTKTTILGPIHNKSQ